MDDETIECPKDKGNWYFLWVCEEIFREKGLRPWCRKCDAYERAVGGVPNADEAGPAVAVAPDPAAPCDEPATVSLLMGEKESEKRFRGRICE
jgi:hypothetical protein